MRYVQGSSRTGIRVSPMQTQCRWADHVPYRVFVKIVEILRLRAHSQNMPAAARQMAEKKTVGHLSWRVATRLLGIAEPLGVRPAIGQHSLCDGEAVEKDCRTHVIAHRPCRHEDAERTSVFVSNRVKLRIHATSGAPHHSDEDPMVLQCFQRLYSVLCGPYSRGASNPEERLADNHAQIHFDMCCK